MKTIIYTATDIAETMTCSVCGAVVESKASQKHNSFHDSLARLLGIEVDD